MTATNMLGDIQACRADFTKGAFEWRGPPPRLHIDAVGGDHSRRLGDERHDMKRRQLSGLRSQSLNIGDGRKAVDYFGPGASKSEA